MTTRRFYANGAPQQTLSAQINSSATSLTVASFAGWPTQFPFFATLELGTSAMEVVSVTGITGGVATIVRAQDGTAAISHLAGATFDFTYVRQDFDEANLHTSSNSGVHGVSGNVVGVTDVQTLTNKTLTSPTISGPTITGTSSGANATLSGTLGVTGTATLGVVNASGVVTASAAGTALSVTNNATVGGVLTAGTVTSILNPKQFANEAAAGTATAGLIVYLTAPTSSGYTAGLYRGNGTIWVPVDLRSDTNAIQQLSFVPGGPLDTPLAGTATWITAGNVLVPVWATQVIIKLDIYGILATLTTNNVAVQLRLGAATGRNQRVLDHGSTAGRFSHVCADKITGLTTGSQSLTLFATFTAGTGVYRVDTASWLTAELIFLP